MSSVDRAGRAIGRKEPNRQDAGRGDPASVAATAGPDPAAQPSSRPAMWEQVWSEGSGSDFDWWVQRECNGRRGGRIHEFIARRVGSMAGLRTIEVGSGLGVFSWLFAEWGASVTLLDYSERALELAEKRFGAAGVKANFILGDAFAEADRLSGQYDVAMSYGTVEHYRPPERYLLPAVHARMVRPGGAVVISVPNRMFLLHEALKWYQQRTGAWNLGYEGAFTRQELLWLGRSLGLENLTVVGTSVRLDARRYMQQIIGSPKLRRLIPIRPGHAPAPVDVASFLDDYLGADLAVLGCTSTASAQAG